MNKLPIVIPIRVVAFVLLFVALLVYVGSKTAQDTKVKSDVILVLGGHVISGTSSKKSHWQSWHTNSWERFKAAFYY